MGFGSPGVNLHAPGPIGDTTPSTLAGTTLNLLSTTVQFQIAYDVSNVNQLYTSSNGDLNVHLGNVDGPVFYLRYGASMPLLQVGGNIVSFFADSGSYTTGNFTTPANFPRYCTYSQPGASADGIGGPAVHTVSVVINSLDTVLFTASLVTFPAGISAPNMPTADPHVAGTLWSNLGIVTRSSG